MPRKKDFKEWKPEDPTEAERQAQREYALQQIKKEEEAFDQTKGSLQDAAPKYARWINGAVDDEKVDAKTKAFIAGMVFDRTGHAATRKVETVEREKKDRFESKQLVNEVLESLMSLPHEIKVLIAERLTSEKPGMKQLEARHVIESKALSAPMTNSELLESYKVTLHAKDEPHRRKDEDADEDESYPPQDDR